MSNDITPQEGTNPELEVEVEETTTEVGTEETPDDTEDVETLKEKLAKAEQAKRELTVRAKKAEDALKGAPKPTQTISTPSNEQIETTVLKAQGMDIDSINYLAKLAKVNGTGLIEAQNDELFLNYKAKKEADVKAQKAKLGASKGSGTIKKEKDLTTPGLTEEERKEIWKSRQS